MNQQLLSGLAAQILGQDVDLAFGFEAEAAPGAFVVLGFEGREALFDEFEIAVDLVADDPSIDLHALLDTPAALGIYDKYDEPRYLHGVIAEVERGQTGFSRTEYRVILRPSLHRMNYASDSRIFQATSVPDIAKTLLNEHGINDVEWKLALSHEPREYAVQYGETAYDFLRRILAEEGIFFWFEHSATSHKMIISDAPLSMPALTAAPELTYNNTPGGAVKGSYIARFNQIERLRATNRVAADYSFKQPAYHQRQKSVQYAQNGAKGQYELYNYPGRHKADDAGRPFNDHALEAHRVEATTAEGETNNIQLSAGFIFTLADHPDAAANTDHRLIAVHHHGVQPSALEEETPDDGATRYKARFTTQPARLPYRPINPNPKPMVEGPQIAHVTGPDGEEIYTDEHGRVKIWFPWDRHNDKNEHSSTWVRVSQGWAGGAWGSMAIPRIGQEVIVDFLEGDPDQPIITGRTYHATNRPPYDLPANKTRMTIKSKTHKGDGYNELRFEDEAGREEVWMHAQKDHNIKVKNNREKRVDVNEFESIGANKSAEIGNNMTVKVGGNYSFVVGANKALDFVSNVHQKFTGLVGEKAKQLGVPGFINLGKGNYNELIGMNKSEVVTLAKQEAVGLSKTTTVGRNEQTFIGHNKHTFVAGSAMHESAKISTMVAGETWQVACGSGAIVIHSDGKVEIKGTAIDIVADGSVRVNGKDVQIN